MKSQNLEMLISQNPNDLSEQNSEFVGQCQSFHPIMNSNFSSSPSSKGRADHHDDEHDDDKEDEDMANCLILLAQGPPAFQPSSSLRKFMGAPEGQNGAGKAEGCCAYECKTCSRTFQSFQALGGHRSSHKNAAACNRNPISVNISSPIDQLRLNNYNDKMKLVNNNNNNNRNKVHTCSICGVGFMSGQALGGHMRRHRRVCGGASEESGEIDRRRPNKKQRSNLLCRFDLDLNLPAPEDDTRDQPTPTVVQIAATSLVGCHY